MKRLFLVLVAALALLAPAVGQAASGPAIAFNPSSNDYGTIDANTTSSQTFTLRNSGGKATSALKVTLTGSSAFSVTADSCTGTSLGPKKSCSITVQYAPTTDGSSDTGTLTVMSKKPAASASASLTGKSSVVNQAPTVQLTVVSQTPPFGFGDVVDFTVQVTDEAPVDCARVSVAYILGHSTHGHPKSSTAGCVGSITESPDASHAGANNIYAWFFASYTDLGAPPLQGSDDVFLYDPLASFPDVIASCESFGGTFSLGGSNPDSYWTCAAWDSADVAEFETRDALLATACVSSARIFHTASAETDANPGAESTTECLHIPPTP